MLGSEYFGLRLVGSDRRLGLGHRRPIVIVHELRQHVARMDALKVLDRQSAQIAGHFRGYGSQVGLQISVVGSLPPGTTLPSRPIARDDENDNKGYQQHQNAPGELRHTVPVE